MSERTEVWRPDAEPWEAYDAKAMWDDGYRVGLSHGRNEAPAPVPEGLRDYMERFLAHVESAVESTGGNEFELGRRSMLKHLLLCFPVFGSPAPAVSDGEAEPTYVIDAHQEDGSWWGNVRGTGAFATGRSLGEMLAELQEALELVLSDDSSAPVGDQEPITEYRDEQSEGWRDQELEGEPSLDAEGERDRERLLNQAECKVKAALSAPVEMREAIKKALSIGLDNESGLGSDERVNQMIYALEEVPDAVLSPPAPVYPPDQEPEGEPPPVERGQPTLNVVRLNEKIAELEEARRGHMSERGPTETVQLAWLYDLRELVSPAPEPEPKVEVGQIRRHPDGDQMVVDEVRTASAKLLPRIAMLSVPLSKLRSWPVVSPAPEKPAEPPIEPGQVWEVADQDSFKRRVVTRVDGDRVFFSSVPEGDQVCYDWDATVERFLRRHTLVSTASNEKEGESDGE